MIKKTIYFILLITLIMIGFSNNHIITIYLIPNYPIIEAKLYIIMFLCFLFGLITNLLSNLTDILKLKYKNYKQSKNIKNLTKEIEEKNNGS
ncbi:MAG: LapA family protein [Rickettsiales bacterium]|nr:LapA family protein [Rickettsiales bacterium]